MRFAMISAAALALAIAPRVASAEQRPTAISMGVSATAEGAPFSHDIVGLPVSIDVGSLVSGEVWWHGSASFGAADAPGEGSGHTFELSTGPRVTHCWSRYCIGAGLELGWGHSRWDVSARDSTLTFDDVHLEARLRAAVALSPSGQVLLEASGGPRARYYLRATDDMGPLDHIDRPLTRGLAAGLALVVRN